MRKNRLYRNRLLQAFGVCLLLLAGSATAWSQTWEFVYGGNKCNEQGYNNIAPVNGTCGNPNGTTPNGYIAIGETKSRGNGANCVDNDVYIVRIGNNGVPLWEATYDINGFQNDDKGYSIKELANGGGFIVTGSTMLGGNWDIFIMKITCKGAVSWVNTYGGTGADEAWDIIETTSGTLAAGTSAGDFVVSGTTTSAGTTQDAYLMRVTAAGVLIWDAAYDFGLTMTGDAEWFHSLIEATPNTPAMQTSGDIVAVGASLALGPPAAIAARVDGNTGGINALLPSLQNFASYPGTEFWETRELTVGSQAGNLVFAGMINFPGAMVYTVLNNGNPCSNPLADNAVTGNLSNDQARGYAIREVTNVTGVTAGTLVITGRFDPGAGGNADMFWLAENPATLAVVGGFERFGGQGATDNDWGQSIYEVPGSNGRTDGFIICGLSQSNLEGANPADPQDMYVVKTNANGQTQCSISQDPAEQNNFGNPTCVTPTIRTIALSNPASANKWDSDWDDSVCTSTSSKRVTGRDKAEEISLSSNENLRFYPNPVKAGTLLNLDFTTGSEDELHVVITNSLGEAVRNLAVPNMGKPTSFSVSTNGLPAGSYIIRVTDGVEVSVVHVVVE